MQERNDGYVVGYTRDLAAIDLLPPSGKACHHPLNYAAFNRDYQTALFGNRYEYIRRDEAVSGMIPAQQYFGFDDLAGEAMEFWLEI
ncbi:hypothetical protein SAMN05421663_10237 [Terribacillus halophilus]|uniref:Uncharacterized protein n=1 Tax=Terribacillus halophilus TaxID=361279 RepID=A0A1G6KJG3_9BACI|nr:hypothetical protein SAMN05421663_10237 [Terribacillus halophilus]